MKKIESGRSMIEMLGVLAIIGVLSIGGLAAYNSAMNRNTANEILNDVSTCLILARSDSATGDCYSSGSGSTAVTGILKKTAEDAKFTLAAAKDSTTGRYSVTVTAATDGNTAIKDALTDRLGTDLTLTDNE